MRLILIIRNFKSDEKDFSGCPVLKNLLANVGDTALIPGLGKFHMLQGN